MFVLLEHTTRDGVHWDFIIELPGRERLPTWRLRQNPLAHAGHIAAEPIDDHRRLYLDYEGEISGDRGRVRRLDRGAAVVEQFDPQGLVARLDGDQLRGRFEIAVEPDGGTRFRKIEDWHEAGGGQTVA